MGDANKRRWVLYILSGLGSLVLVASAGLYAAGIWKNGRAPYDLKLPKVVAKVGEDPISRDLVYQRMRQHEGMNPEGFKDKSADAMKRLAVRVVDTLIQQHLILSEAERLKILVTEADVEQQYNRTQANFSSP